jgi:UDP-3-O-[3-hydroxymyristoyl] glucosamine N-acyltransferase
LKLNSLLKNIDLREVDKDIDITSIQDLSKATKDSLSFITSKKYLDDLKQTKAGAVLVTKDYEKYTPKSSIAVVCDDPYLYMAYASKFFKKDLVSKEYIKPVTGERVKLSDKASIGSNVKIADDSIVLAGAVLGNNVTIGKNCVIFPNVTIYNDTVIGDNCRIHAGSVIGSDGFGYAHTKDGRHIKIYHNGNVIIEDDVEIGANCTIDRAVFGSTIIKKGTKIDNLVQVGHNCTIGENSILVSQVGLSGSTELGRNVVMGGQSATAGHLKIGDFATIAARGGVSKSIEGGRVYGGFPLTLQKDWLKLQAKISKLIKKR